MSVPAARQGKKRDAQTYGVASSDEHLSFLLGPFLSLTFLRLRKSLVEWLVVSGDSAHLAFLLRSGGG